MGFMDTLALPPAMTSQDTWINWKIATRNGNETKIPICPHTEEFGATDDPDTWASYEKASELSNERDWLHLGFVFTEQDDLVGIDLDHMRDADTGEIDDDAEEIINKLDSYTEISPSGEGFHIIVKGDLPRGRNRHEGVEMYEDGRFFTVTGNRLPGTEPEVKGRNGPLRVVHHQFVAEDKSAQETASQRASGGGTDLSDADVSLEDEEILQKAKDSRNGKKFEALWNGITSGYASQSEADLALCSYLAFWTGGDADQMDRLFQESGLYRPKWDKEHFSDGKTYGEATINKAIETSTDFYTGDD